MRYVIKMGCVNSVKTASSFFLHLQTYVNRMAPIRFTFLPKCKLDVGHPVHMKFIFSDADSLSMVIQSSN